MKTLSSIAAALVISATACSDPSGPIDNGQTRSITVNLCSGLAPGVWFAYQNEGGAWTRVTPNGNGQIVFDATEKVSVASAISFFGLTFTEIINATATELEGTTAASCESEFGDRSMSGTVTGVTGDQFARISAAASVDASSAVDPAWLLEDLPNRPLDIVAARYATSSTQPAQRVVVRRSVTPGNGEIPALDFNGAESGALENAVATFTNIPANGSLTALSAVQTANGTTQQLGDLTTALPESTQPVGYVSLPSSLRIASDIHYISASAFNVDATQTIVHYYKTPAAKTLAFGPIVSEPTITNLATTPIVRPRVQLASQSALSSATAVDFGESVGDESRFVSVLTTAGFLGGAPQTWDIAVPDMSSAEYDPAWALQTTTYNWSVTAYGATAASWPFGVVPADGATLIASTRGKVEVIELGASQRRAVRGMPKLFPRVMR